MTKLINYIYRGERRLGTVKDGVVTDINRAYAALRRSEGETAHAELAAAHVPSDPLKFLQLGSKALEATKEALHYAEALSDEDAGQGGIVVSEGDVTLLPPITNPPKIVCVARNYGKHAAEAGKPLSEIPILFPRFAATLVPAGGNVVVPRASKEVDWEGELAVVIGQGGRHISRENAMDHVAGYSIFNDVSVRDRQFRVNQYTEGKNFHASGPFGPHLVLTDELADPHSLRITTTLNDAIVQDGSTSEMIFDIPDIIQFVSAFIELEAGDVIPMGTPAGVGFTRTPPLFLRPGDRISVAIEGLGTLTNPVVLDDLGRDN
ncbi:fumarylacetoacetate hydrolase family protein [Arthrobacter sp. Cr_A7]|uniref:fumarylacetoacetate hydrolase family protein n=1 Tax=Arthrobacter sp. Cr_A7 TaxID=3031017 RepID=UPI0023DA671D|nr:fumarylacetoacetate hydrolase family protein [Arthrobacter sp. Cr_A7]MDF2050430.1 fumarylacetoacetate hydrolase family protein [Arthrobacter sp. Cr_A7]